MRTGQTWGEYVTAAREHATMTRPELAQRIGVRRSTVYRWETAGVRPDDSAVVARLAEAVGVDLDEALAAAGLRPTDNPPAEPRSQEPPRDPYIVEMERRLNDPEISEEEKAGYRALLRYAVDMQQPPAEPDRRRSPGRKAG